MTHSRVMLAGTACCSTVVFVPAVQRRAFVDPLVDHRIRTEFKAAPA
ncbi:hypothetical protein G7047_19865 [Diaphorobacter sp. HDW4A]|nr:hypothetical protein [Diaphorobacter sp. HDW4A]QIL81927.1 hypothetical protein G7047_19865 [Diaphorobacter sp. HDW4A]